MGNSGRLICVRVGFWLILWIFRKVKCFLNNSKIDYKTFEASDIKNTASGETCTSLNVSCMFFNEYSNFRTPHKLVTLFLQIFLHLQPKKHVHCRSTTKNNLHNKYHFVALDRFLFFISSVPYIFQFHCCTV